MARSPMHNALAAFDEAMKIAERHRATLRQRFGLSDKTIGMMCMARSKPLSARGKFAAATVAAMRQRGGNAAP